MVASILTLALIWGFIAIKDQFLLFKGLDLFIFILIIVLAGITLYRAFKKQQEIDAGMTADDELSMRIKYKAGYYAYLVTMYMWLLIFILKDAFPDIETLLGGGILFSGLIAFLSKILVKRNFNE